MCIADGNTHYVYEFYSARSFKRISRYISLFDNTQHMHTCSSNDNHLSDISNCRCLLLSYEKITKSFLIFPNNLI